MAGADTPVAASGVPLAPPGIPGAPPDWVGTPRARKRAGLSIYSILLIMLLSVSVLSSIVVGIIGYINGTEALRAIAYEKLVEIRENRAREVTQLFATIENAVRLGAMNETSKQAAVAFAEGFAELDAAAARRRGIHRARGLLSRHVRGRPVDGDRRRRGRGHVRPQDERREVPAGRLRDPVRLVGRGDPHRRRRRRQRLVGGAREVPRLLPRDDAAAGLRGRPDDRHRRATSSTARSRASTSARTCSRGRTGSRICRTRTASR